jgi:hypothetical protein
MVARQRQLDHRINRLLPEQGRSYHFSLAGVQQQLDERCK